LCYIVVSFFSVILFGFVGLSGMFSFVSFSGRSVLVV